MLTRGGDHSCENTVQPVTVSFFGFFSLVHLTLNLDLFIPLLKKMGLLGRKWS